MQVILILCFTSLSCLPPSWLVQESNMTILGTMTSNLSIKSWLSGIQCCLLWETWFPKSHFQPTKSGFHSLCPGGMELIYLWSLNISSLCTHVIDFVLSQNEKWAHLYIPLSHNWTSFFLYFTKASSCHRWPGLIWLIDNKPHLKQNLKAYLS